MSAHGKLEARAGVEPAYKGFADLDPAPTDLQPSKLRAAGSSPAAPTKTPLESIVLQSSDKIGHPASSQIPADSFPTVSQKKPLAIDLFAGLGGWAEGFLAEGFEVIGFDVERHQYGDQQYPAQLVLQDVLTLYGSQFRDAAVIVASPPCQAYSYRAMPWKRAKALPPPSNELFDACFRIQREACAAAGRYVPLIVENVKGAQPWVGRAAWHFGSFYLWGDVPPLMPIPAVLRKSQHEPLCETPAGTGRTSWFFGNSKHEGRHYGVKGAGGSWFGDYQSQKAVGNGANTRHFSSKSTARKAASAQIAKIPFELSRHIARVFKPQSKSQTPRENQC